MQKGIAVAGHMTVDTIYPINHYPGPGELATIEDNISKSTGGAIFQRRHFVIAEQLKNTATRNTDHEQSSATESLPNQRDLCRKSPEPNELAGSNAMVYLDFEEFRRLLKSYAQDWREMV